MENHGLSRLCIVSKMIGRVCRIGVVGVIKCFCLCPGVSAEDTPPLIGEFRNEDGIHFWAVTEEHPIVFRFHVVPKVAHELDPVVDVLSHKVVTLVWFHM